MQADTRKACVQTNKRKDVSVAVVIFSCYIKKCSFLAFRVVSIYSCAPLFEGKEKNDATLYRIILLCYSNSFFSTYSLAPDCFAFLHSVGENKKEEHRERQTINLLPFSIGKITRVTSTPSFRHPFSRECFQGNLPISIFFLLFSVYIYFFLLTIRRSFEADILPISITFSFLIVSIVREEQ